MVTQLMDRVEEDFHSSGRPLHVTDPGCLMFRIMTVEEFKKMSHVEMQDLHADYHLLVTGYPEALFGFDMEGIATLGSSSGIITIQGV
jgi:hypothetical protein